jgi:hypothetical protein
LTSNDALRRTLTEWSPTTLQGLAGKIFYLHVIVGSALIAVRRPPIPISWAIIVAALAIFGLTAVRNLPWFGLASLPVWALTLDRGFAIFADRPTRSRTLRLMVTLLGAVLIVTWPGGIRAHLGPGNTGIIPDEETALNDLSGYLIQHPDGLLFHDANWGAYLEAHIGPNQQVFIDTRFEVHPLTVWQDYEAVIAGRFEWEAILARYGVLRVATDPAKSPNLERALEASSDWRHVWTTDDNTSHIVIWARSAAADELAEMPPSS